MVITIATIDRKELWVGAADRLEGGGARYLAMLFGINVVERLQWLAMTARWRVRAPQREFQSRSDVASRIMLSCCHAVHGRPSATARRVLRVLRASALSYQYTSYSKHRQIDRQYSSIVQ